MMFSEHSGCGWRLVVTHHSAESSCWLCGADQYHATIRSVCSVLLLFLFLFFAPSRTNFLFIFVIFCLLVFFDSSFYLIIIIAVLIEAFSAKRRYSANLQARAHGSATQHSRGERLTLWLKSFFLSLCFLAYSWFDHHRLHDHMFSSCTVVHLILLYSSPLP